MSGFETMIAYKSSGCDRARRSRTVSFTGLGVTVYEIRTSRVPRAMS
jgi:hypothetical protein